jgi:hypothetical protein
MTRYALCLAFWRFAFSMLSIALFRRNHMLDRVMKLEKSL